MADHLLSPDNLIATHVPYHDKDHIASLLSLQTVSETDIRIGRLQQIDLSEQLPLLNTGFETQMEQHEQCEVMPDYGKVSIASITAQESKQMVVCGVPTQGVSGDPNLVYNSRGYEVCGQLNQHSKPCQRIGRCPFHGSKKGPDPVPPMKKEKKERPQKLEPFKQGWTRDEHRRFLHGLLSYGKGRWKEIALVVGTRNPTQIQSHAQKFFLRQKQQSKNKRSIHDITLEDLQEMEHVPEQSQTSRPPSNSPKISPSGTGPGVGPGAGPGVTPEVPKQLKNDSNTVRSPQGTMSMAPTSPPNTQQNPDQLLSIYNYSMYRPPNNQIPIETNQVFPSQQIRGQSQQQIFSNSNLNLVSSQLPIPSSSLPPPNAQSFNANNCVPSFWFPSPNTNNYAASLNNNKTLMGNQENFY